MSQPFNNIESKAERAAVYHLNGIASNLAGVTIHAGTDSADLNLPYIVASAQSATEHIYGTGQFAVEVIIDVSSSADDTTPSAHTARVARVRDEFANSWVSLSLSNQMADFTAVGVIIEPSIQKIEDRHWSTSIPLTIHCRASD